MRGQLPSTTETISAPGGGANAFEWEFNPQGGTDPHGWLISVHVGSPSAPAFVTARLTAVDGLRVATTRQVGPVSLRTDQGWRVWIPWERVRMVAKVEASGGAAADVDLVVGGVAMCLDRAPTGARVQRYGWTAEIDTAPAGGTVSFVAPKGATHYRIGMVTPDQGASQIEERNDEEGTLATIAIDLTDAAQARSWRQWTPIPGGTDPTIRWTNSDGAAEHDVTTEWLFDLSGGRLT